MRLEGSIRHSRHGHCSFPNVTSRLEWGPALLWPARARDSGQLVPLEQHSIDARLIVLGIELDGASERVERLVATAGNRVSHAEIVGRTGAARIACEGVLPERNFRLVDLVARNR